MYTITVSHMTLVTSTSSLRNMPSYTEKLKAICFVQYNSNGYFTHKNTKAKVAPLCAMKAYRGSRDIAPLIFNLSTRWR
jgi:hypothetical protein